MNRRAIFCGVLVAASAAAHFAIGVVFFGVLFLLAVDPYLNTPPDQPV